MKFAAPLLVILVLSCSVSSCAILSPDRSVFPRPVIRNPSFEITFNDWVSDWIRKAIYDDGTTSYYRETGVAHSGNSSIRIKNNTDNDARAIQDVEVIPDSVYRLSCWIMANNIVGNSGANLAVIDSGAMSESVFDTQGQWKLVEFYGITGPHQTKIKVAPRIGSWGTFVTGEAYFDDVEIELVKSVSGGFGTQSFAFGCEYSEERAKAFFARIQDERLVSNRLSMSALFAAVLLIMLVLYTAHEFFIKKKFPKVSRFLDSAITRWRYLLFAISLVVFFIASRILSANRTAFDIQFIFAVFLIAAAIVSGYLAKNRRLTKESIVSLVIFLGIGVRLCYFLYSVYTGDYSHRQHDVWGAWSHPEYIKYIANHFALPPVGLNETYHPPVHYILCAVVYKIASLFGVAEPEVFEAVQVFLVFLSSLVIVLTNRIFKLIGCNAGMRIIGVSFASFLPSLVMMSATLANDVTVYFFFTLGFYYLVKWTKFPTVKHTIVLALSVALAMLSKKSAFVLCILAAIVFFVELLKNKKKLAKYIKLALVFIAIAVPLGASYQVRNYLLFQQGPGYTIPLTNTQCSNNPYHLVGVPVEELLTRPFVPGDDTKRMFLPGELIRSALFETFMRDYDYNLSVPGIDSAAVLLMLFFLVNLGLMILYLVVSWKKDYGDNRYIMLVNLGLSVFVFLQMHFSVNYLMVYDFRYMAPFVSVSLAYFIAQANLRFADSKIKLLRYIVPGQFAMWCVCSVVFLLLVGF